MKDENLLEMTGSVEQVIFRNEKNEYTVLEINDGQELITAVGIIPMVSCGEELRLIGTWSYHPNFGKQFKVQAFERFRPATSSAILKYLSSGAIKGIGPATATKIVKEFGDNTLDIIENNPERLCVIKGITQSKALKISEEFRQIYGMKEIMLYLGQYGITPEESVRVWKVYGNQAVEKIQEDPYCLCEEGLDIGFERVDLIAAAMERPQNDGCRVRAGVLYILRHNANNGHTCLPQDKLTLTACRLLGVQQEIVEIALTDLQDDRSLIFVEMKGKMYIFLPRFYEAESYIAARLWMMLRHSARVVTGIEKEIGKVQKKFNISYAEKQKVAICEALSKGLLILTGGPGTGKTTTLNAIISILKKKGEKVFLAAPTGRAAKRMSEVTGEDAKTIHRLLQVEWDETDHHIFAKNEKNLLECDALIVDEFSMVDVLLFEGILKALPLGCRLILVGDYDQLPSVGPGNVLGDMISSELLPVVQLNEIFRQSMQSLIVTNAHKIVKGEFPELYNKKSDFFFLPRSEVSLITSTIIGLYYERLPASYGYSYLTDIQVLCPSRKGELGTIELNKQLQEIVNPPSRNKKEIQINGFLLREGDKVMQIKNDYDLLWTKVDGTTGEGVFNGDVGILIEINKEASTLTVQMDDRYVLYSTENAAELELAYAITVHKSQGNEFQAVIIPMFTGPSRLYFRNLLYTAITRARSLLILVGTENIVKKMVENDKKTKRYSGLYYFLKEVSGNES